MNLLQLAGSLPRDPLFREWVSQYTVPPQREVTIEMAAEFIRIACDVESRREIGSDSNVAARFNEFIRRPYVAWRDRQKEVA